MRHSRVAGHSYLSREEVEKALRNAFEWLYDTTTASGNLPWLRNALVGT